MAAASSTFLGQLLLGTAALATVGAGAALVGVLPAPLQSAVSELAGEVGFVVPSGATTATPAQPGEAGEPATPAVPATPPADPAGGQTFGLDHRPVNPPEPDRGVFDEFVELKAAIEQLRAEHSNGHGPSRLPPGPSHGVPGPPGGAPGRP